MGPTPSGGATDTDPLLQLSHYCPAVKDCSRHGRSLLKAYQTITPLLLKACFCLLLRSSAAGGTISGAMKSVSCRCGS